MVELDDGIEAVAAELSARGGAAIEVARQGSRLDVTSTTLSDEVLFDLLRDVLADSGAGLRRLLPRRTSLEDVYLRAGSMPVALAAGTPTRTIGAAPPSAPSPPSEPSPPAPPVRSGPPR